METKSNLIETIREIPGGFLGRIAGLPDSPVIFVPITAMGFCSADNHRGVPAKARGAKWIRVRAVKGPDSISNQLTLKLTEKGWRLTGWGGLRVSAVSHDVVLKQEILDKNVQALLDMASSEELKAFSPIAAATKAAMEKAAAEKAAKAAAERAEREAREAAEKAEKEALQRAIDVHVAVYGHGRNLKSYEVSLWLESIGGNLNMPASELTELATIDRELKELEAAQKKEAEDRKIAEAIGVAVEELRAMNDKQRRLAAHKARLAGKI